MERVGWEDEYGGFLELLGVDLGVICRVSESVCESVFGGLFSA